MLSSFLVKKSYSPDENIIKEGEYGTELFLIIEGKVSVIHKESHTYLIDLFVSS